jgi:hypothetical protein
LNLAVAARPCEELNEQGENVAKSDVVLILIAAKMPLASIIRFVWGILSSGGEPVNAIAGGAPGMSFEPNKLRRH